MKKNIITIVIMSMLSVPAFAGSYAPSDASQRAEAMSHAGRLNGAVASLSQHGAATTAQRDHMAQTRESVAHAERSNPVNKGFEGASVTQRDHAAQVRESVAHNQRYSGMASAESVGFAGATTAQLNKAAQMQAAATTAAKMGDALAHTTEGVEGATEGQLNHMAQVKAAQTAAAKGMAVNPDAVAQAAEQEAHSARYAGMNPGQPATNSTINQSAASVNPHTPVTATVNGVTIHTTAGEIAKTNPQAQISMPMDSVFTGPVHTGNNDHSKGSSRGEHGTGNGGNNAANSNSAHGLGGGSHIGGGSQQGGGFHGNW